jgi:membrane fusion protein (multidrug efflux system)
MPTGAGEATAREILKNPRGERQRAACCHHHTAVRYVVTILAVLAVVAGLAFTKASQISMLIKFGKAAEKAGPPPETIGTAVATEQTWERTLSAVGSVAAAKGVTVSNDAPGIVSKIHFESGAVVRQGQVLVELDSSVERAQLASAEARKELATINVGRSRTLASGGSIAASVLDNDEAVLKTSEADLSALRAQIDRKIVRAPFAGRLGIRSVNLGQYLNPGTPITVLESMDSVYVDFTFPQQRLAEVPVGTPVRITIEGTEGGPSDGVIAAVDPEIDSVTRTVKLRATIPNKKDKLRPGMFARVEVVMPERAPVISIPAPALVHAPYGDSVFVIEDKADAPPGPDGKPAKVARQQFVRIGETRGDFVSIVDGVKGGQEVAVAGAFKLRNGAGVVIRNDIKARAELSPQPQNR